MFAYNFNTLVPNNFGGLTVIWQNHSQIKIQYVGSAWNFLCYPIYDGTATYTTYSTTAFNINAWNFVSCATNLNTNPYIYFASTDVFLNPAQQTLSSTNKPTLPATTSLTISDQTNYEWGVLFIRQLRLWNYCYSNVIFLSRV